MIWRLFRYIWFWMFFTLFWILGTFSHFPFEIIFLSSIFKGCFVARFSWELIALFLLVEWMTLFLGELCFCYSMDVFNCIDDLLHILVLGFWIGMDFKDFQVLFGCKNITSLRLKMLDPYVMIFCESRFHLHEPDKTIHLSWSKQCITNQYVPLTIGDLFLLVFVLKVYYER